MRQFLSIVLYSLILAMPAGFSWAQPDLFTPVLKRADTLNIPEVACKYPFEIEYFIDSRTLRLSGSLYAPSEIERFEPACKIWYPPNYPETILIGKQLFPIVEAIDKYRLKTVELNSTGGSILVASILAEEIHARKMNTTVLNGDWCLSACVTILMAGETKIAQGVVGVHDVSFPTLDLSDPAFETALEIANNLVRVTDKWGGWHLALRYFRDTTPPDSFAILTNEQKIAFGLLPAAKKDRWIFDVPLPDHIQRYDGSGLVLEK